MLKVMDFYTKGKLIINCTDNSLESPIDFYILVNDNGNIRELTAHIPKKFSFKQYLISTKYEELKLKEFNILIDFIESNEKELIDKWNLTKDTLKDLLIGLELNLIENYSNMNNWDKCTEKISVLFKRGI